jgi:hypothetical protein
VGGGGGGVQMVKFNNPGLGVGIGQPRSSSSHESPGNDVWGRDQSDTL